MASVERPRGFGSDSPTGSGRARGSPQQPSPTKDIKLSSYWEATQIIVIVIIHWNILQYEEILVKE